MDFRHHPNMHNWLNQGTLLSPLVFFVLFRAPGMLKMWEKLPFCTFWSAEFSQFEEEYGHSPLIHFIERKAERQKGRKTERKRNSISTLHELQKKAATIPQASRKNWVEQSYSGRELVAPPWDAAFPHPQCMVTRNGSEPPHKRVQWTFLQNATHR